MALSPNQATLLYGPVVYPGNMTLNINLWQTNLPIFDLVDATSAGFGLIAAVEMKLRKARHDPNLMAVHY